LQINDVAGDGNCMFHSISVQAYGSMQPHSLIREKCMDYILANKDFFKDFVEEEKESIEQYVDRKR